MCNASRDHRIVTLLHKVRAGIPEQTLDYVYASIFCAVTLLIKHLDAVTTNRQARDWTTHAATGSQICTSASKVTAHYFLIT